MRMLVLRNAFLPLRTSLLDQIIVSRQHLCSHHQTCSQKRPPGDTRTGISRHFVQPLRLLPILSLPLPSRDPRLPLVDSNFLITLLGLLDTRKKHSHLVGVWVGAWCGGVALLEVGVGRWGLRARRGMVG